MFHSARFKLTAWYLLIIMLISLVFSAALYSMVCRELERGFRRAGMRLNVGQPGFLLPQYSPQERQEMNSQLIQDFDLTKRRVIFNLLAANGMILAVSALASYFLAGKALEPIAVAMEEQKRFVADASHELRTPITALKASIEVTLRDKKLTLKKARDTFKSNLEDINALHLLTSHLLNLTNFQANHQPLTLEKIKVGKIVKNASQKILPLAKKKKIKLDLAVKKQTILAHRESFEKMILIFLDNAVKYTPKNGRITISTKTTRKNLLIKVKDTGVGIAKKDLPRIFDRFYRAPPSRSKNKVSGFGLGLSLAKKIIELHRGTVKVTSTLGKGTTFTIKFPRNQS
jgi:two-component system sensor histidine kinase CiaH